MSEIKMKIPQHSLNLLRQCLNLAGWAKTPVDFYTAGRLLAVVLPELDLTWVKSVEELAALPQAERAAYTRHDREFGLTLVELTLTQKEISLIRTCLEANLGRLSPDKYTFELFLSFGIGTD